MSRTTRDIHQENAALRKEIAELRPALQEVMSVLEEVRSELADLRQENAQLKEEVRILRRPQNSGNSSLPPSSDIIPRTRSLRENQGKKPGGQPGHEGTTLKMQERADHVIDHMPPVCSRCGKDLSALPGELAERRQQIDLPPVRAEVTEHRVFSKVCRCGEEVRGEFPAQVRSCLSYGPGIGALVAYLSVRHYLPYGRIAELLRDSYGLRLSTGTIALILQRFTQQGAPVYQSIRRELEDCGLVGSDETGAKVNGRTHWMHVWQNPQGTFVACHANRGSKAIKEYFPEGFPRATLVSDCLAGQLATPAAAHQICIAHLRRELNYFDQVFPSPWVTDMNALLRQAIATDRSRGETPDIARLKVRLKDLLDEEQYEAPPKVQAFWLRLVRLRQSVLHFLDDPKVPPDNNGSERAIRNVKVKQKVSGQFRSEWGAQAFALIRSIIDTAAKRKENILDTLRLIAEPDLLLNNDSG